MAQSDENPPSSLVRQIPTDLSSTEAVHAFLTDPLPTVAALITGALASGRTDFALAAGHIVQAVFKGRAFKQLGEELDELLKKGKIKSDYGETKFGFPSLVELMRTIDGDATDEDKLRAAKTMFVALNSPDTPSSEEGLRYRLFRIVLTLTGPQVAMLNACFVILKKGTYGHVNSENASTWFRVTGKLIGHDVVPLMEQDESVLIRSGIMYDRVFPDRSGVVQLTTWRLTDLGVKIAELVERYDSAIPKADRRD
jgi:hypothetical protein